MHVLRRAAAAIGAGLLVAVLVQLGRDGNRAPRTPEASSARGDDGSVSPQDRCAEALALVTARQRWALTCRWRAVTDTLQGEAFPPPVGPPPFDDPHVEIYVDPAQTKDSVARAIAHEFGHMHHTREFSRVDEWLRARGLPPGTADEIWTEDYAEVFAALFAPPSDSWRAPTPRPTPGDLARLRSQFFGDE